MDRDAGKVNSRGEPKLSAQVKLWPTPMAGAETYSAQGGIQLHQAVKRFPTPRTPSATGGGTGLDGGAGARSMMDEETRKELTGGSLNPDWVEWLMDFPPGWTDLKPLKKEIFHAWKELHGQPAWAQEVQENLHSDSVCNVRGEAIADAAPQGPQPRKQQPGKYSDPLPELPRDAARQGTMGAQGDGKAVSVVRDHFPVQAEPGTDLLAFMRQQASLGVSWCGVEPTMIPRVATGVPNRAARLKCIGNGQVPQALVLAWEALTYG